MAQGRRQGHEAFRRAFPAPPRSARQVIGDEGGRSGGACGTVPAGGGLMAPPPIRHAAFMGVIIDTAYTHRARAAGLTEALVREVIDAFYAKVRRDPILGPVFDDIIQDDWPAHLERITSFWLTATRLGLGYEGRGFMPAHLK